MEEIEDLMIFQMAGRKGFMNHSPGRKLKTMLLL
jgi:hypothetical protein